MELHIDLDFFVYPFAERRKETKSEIVIASNKSLCHIVPFANHLFGGNHRNTQGNGRNHAGQESNPLDGASLLVSGRLDIERSINVSLLVQD